MIRVGISGWRYARWRGVFYPPGLVQRLELAYAAERLTSVELNGSFYSLQRPSSYERWAAEVPEDFLFAIKGPRFITHMKKLTDVETPLATFFATGVLSLGDRLGPLLWQLPPNLAFNPDRLAAFFDLLPRRTTDASAHAAVHHDPDKLRVPPDTDTPADRPLRHVLEVRHPSFRTPEFGELLREHDIGTVVADSAGTWPTFEEVTSDLVYVRLHGEDELYASGYSEESLDRWADRIRGWDASGLDVVVYFDNDARVHAPYDAMALQDRLGIAPTVRVDG